MLWEDLREVTLELLFVAELVETGQACIARAVAVLDVRWESHFLIHHMSCSERKRERGFESMNLSLPPGCEEGL